MIYSITANKLYQQCISKPKSHPDYIRYANYRHMYNIFLKIATKPHYANQLSASKNDYKNMELTKNIDSENNDKSGILYTSKLIMI